MVNIDQNCCLQQKAVAINATAFSVKIKMLLNCEILLLSDFFILSALDSLQKT